MTIACGSCALCTIAAILASVRRDLAQWLAKWQGKYAKPRAWVEDNICTSLDLIQRSMPDYVIHSTAGIIGEVDSDVVKASQKGVRKDARRRRRAMARGGAAGAIALCLQRAFFRTPYGILDNIDPPATPGSRPRV
jgi:hypothetical protein